MSKCYMIDLDGTMYKGVNRIDGAKEYIDYLMNNNIKFIFLTNNSSRTQQQCADHMLKMGYTNIKPEMFYTSAMAASDTIKKLYPNKKRAYYIGEKGMKEALVNNDFIIDFDKPDFFFVGLDREATYREYSFGIRALKNGAILVGTNNDRLLLSEEGYNVGNGSVVAMYEYAFNVEAIKIGKPHRPIFDGALRYMNACIDDVVIIGDNLETDIATGVNLNVETVLVTTGVHNMEDCFRLGIKPTYIVDKLTGLLK